MSRAAKTRVLIVEDQTMVREGLKALIGLQDHLEVVGEATDGRAAVDLARELRPDVVLMDVTLPLLNGIDATRHIRTNHPDVQVLGVSVHTEARFVAEMLRAGAGGYILKNSTFRDLEVAIHDVLDGRLHLAPGVLRSIVDEFLRLVDSQPATVFRILTVREREVLQLIAEGRATRDIARTTQVSVKTVETHRANLMRKLGLSSIAELTRYAVKEGLVNLDL